MSNQVATMFKKASCVAVAGLSLLMAQAAIAKTVEETIKKTISERIELPVSEVIKTPFDNLYEVRGRGGSVYINANSDFVVFGGQLYDLDKQLNLTELSMAEMNRIDIDSLPLELALKATYGKGGDRIVTFEDPNCPWCKRLQAEFKKMDVTVYTFVTPTLSPDSFTKTKQVMCAKDPVKAWQDWMGKNVALPKVKDENCDHEVNDVLEVMHGANVAGTPVLLFDNGKRISGYADANRLTQTMKAKSE